MSEPGTAAIQRLNATIARLEAEQVGREQLSALLALKNAELHAELRRRLAESESLGRVLVSLLQQSNLEQLLNIVCTEAQELIGATGSAILLLTDGAWLEVRHQQGQPAEAVGRQPVAGSPAGRVVRTGEPVVLNQPPEPGQTMEYAWPGDLTALLAVALRADGRTIGVLEVINKPGGFAAEDIRLVSFFANQAAMAIEHVRLQQQAERLAVLQERERLARELHDSVTQSLFSITLYANAAALAVAAGKQVAIADYLRELQETAQEAMRDMRLLIFQLHPPELETEGLAAVLQARLAAVEARAGLQTDFRVTGERRLPIAVEEDLYWIAQEALNNVVKHARARHVAVSLTFTAKRVCLEVRDDGAGFDVLAADADSPSAGGPGGSGGGVGLRSISERTARVGGTLLYTSRPGEGTHMSVEVGL